MIRNTNVEIIDKSQIENIQPEPLPGNELKADDTSVRPTIGNAVVKNRLK